MIVSSSSKRADERVLRAKSRASSRALSRAETRSSIKTQGGNDSRSPSPLRWKSPSALEARGDPTPVKYKCFDMGHAENDLTIAVAESFSRGGISRGTCSSRPRSDVDPLVARKIANRMKYEIDVGFQLDLPHGPTRFIPNQNHLVSASPPQAVINGGSNFEVFRFDEGASGGESGLPALHDELGFNGTLGFNNTAHGPSNTSIGPSQGATQTGMNSNAYYAKQAAKAAVAESQSPIVPGDPGRTLVRASQTVKPVSFDKLRNSCSSAHTVVRLRKHQANKMALPVDRLPSLTSEDLKRPKRNSKAIPFSEAQQPTKAQDEGACRHPNPEMKFDRDTFMRMQQERNRKRQDSKVDAPHPSPFVTKTQQAIKEAAEHQEEEEEPPMSKMECLLMDALAHVEVPKKVFTFPTLNSVPQLTRRVTSVPGKHLAKVMSSSIVKTEQSASYASPSASTFTQAPQPSTSSDLTSTTDLSTPTEMPRPSTVMSRVIQETTRTPLPIEVLDVGRYTPQSTIDRMESRFNVDVIRSHTSMF